MLLVRRYVIPAVFVLVAAAIAAFGILSMYTTAYAVTIDGETYDIFDNEEDVENAIKNVESKVEDVLKEPYEVGNDIQCEEVFVLKSHVTGDADDLEELLYDDVDEITDSFILRVDGETVGIGDEEDLEQIIDEVSSQYVNKNTVSVKVLSDVEINFETVPSELEEDIDVMTESLTEVVEDEVTYKVSETQTLKEVVDDVNTSIEDADVSTEQILTLNPELTDEFVNTEEIDEGDIETISDEDTENDTDVQEGQDDTDDENSTDIDNSLTLTEIAEESAEDIVLEEGSVVTVEPEKKLLVVETQDIEKHEKEVEFETVEEEDDNLYIGETETRVEGENGIVEVYETVTKLNGKEVERVQSNYVVTEEPVDEVIAIGTKEYAPEPIIESVPEDVIIDNDTAETDTAEPDVSISDNTKTDNSATYSNNYIWPLSGYSSVSSGYGWRYLNGVSEFHSGIDIPAPAGTPIYASNSGVVITNTYNSARGWYVQVRHSDGYITLYQHMNAQSPLAVGSSVSQGQTVGYVGNTGYSFGSHLHFEVWTSNYTPVNPMTVFTSSTGSPLTDTDYTVSYETSDTVAYSVNDSVVFDSDETSLQNEIIEYAKQFIGCPYVHAGHGPDVFDCSGFTGYVYRHFGIEIYNSVECQLQYGTDVPADVSQMQPGDLIFFATTGTGQATHVGMYIGNGQYIHASSTYGQVMIDTVRSTANRPIVAVKRIV